MDQTMVYVVIGVVVFMGGLFLLAQRRSIAPGSDDLGDVQAALRVAQEAVMAAEQLWLTGRLQKDARFEYVAELMRRYFPSLSDDLVAMMIEAAVMELKSLMATMELGTETQELQQKTLRVWPASGSLTVQKVP